MEPVELGPEYELRPINIGYEWSQTLFVYKDAAMTEPFNFEGQTVKVQTGGGVLFTAGQNMILVEKEGVVMLSLSVTETERLRQLSAAVKWVLEIDEQAVAHGTIPARELLP